MIFLKGRLAVAERIRWEKTSSVKFNSCAVLSVAVHMSRFDFILEDTDPGRSCR